MKIDKFRVLVSLGTTITQVNMLPDGTGVLVEYGSGDTCPTNKQEKLSSEIEFVCHLPESDADRPGHDSREVERPVFVSVDRAGCHYRFRWLTQQACPVCRRSQVQETVGRCEKMTHDQLDGFGGVPIDEKGNVVKSEPNQVYGIKKIVQKAKPGERCYIPYESSLVDVPTGENYHSYAANPADEVTGHYTNERGKQLLDDYAQGPLSFEHCNLL